MKAVLFSLLLLPQFVQAQNLDKRGEKYVDKIMKCARKTVDQRRGGTKSVEIAYRYLTEARYEKDSDRLKQLYKECKRERKSLKRNRIAWDELYKTHSELRSQSDQEISFLVDNYIRPWAECKAGGMDFLIGAGITLGAGLKVGKCRGSNGKKYIAVVPEGMFGLGLGAHVGVSTDEWYFNMRRYFNVKSRTISGNVGIVLSLSMPMMGDEERRSYGVGLGYHFYGSKGRGARIIPLGTDEEYLRKKLFKNL
jgi:hypothetical protein